MTRGRLAIITNNMVYTSNEFNGDMYYDGYGETAIEYLKKVDSTEYLVEAVKEFNEENFNYPIETSAELKIRQIPALSRL
jgi:hypothetical protein